MSQTYGYTYFSINRLSFLFRANVTAAIVSAIVILVGLCVGTGLVIFLKKEKPLCCRQCDEDDWDRVSGIWKDEYRFLNGKNVIPISSITTGKILGIKEAANHLK